MVNNEFRLNTGILNKETVILSKAKIQNVYVKESFLHRLVGVVSLTIESAGDKNSEIEISAIDKKLALEIKERLFQKDKHIDSPDSSQTKIIYQASIIKLFLEGLTQNHLKSLAIIFGFFVGLYFENKDFIEDYDLANKALVWLNINKDIFKSIVLVNLLVLLIGLVVSVIFSTVKMVVQNFNLKVVEHDDSIEISKGLLQTITLTLLPARIQNIEITTNRLKRKIGLHTLTVKQAMANKKQANKLSIVGLDLNRLNYLLNELAPDFLSLQNNQKVRPHKFFKRILLIRFGILALLVNVLLAFQIKIYALLTFILSIIVILICIRIIYHKTYFYIDDSFLTKGSGLVETKTNILELSKIQSVTLVQNIFHKQRGLASIEFYTASQKTILPYLDIIDANKVVDYLLYKVESTEKDWM